MGNQMYDQPAYEGQQVARVTMADRVAGLEKQVAGLQEELRRSMEFAQLVARELGIGG